MLTHAQPIADFTVNVSSGCSPMVVSFQDASSGDIVSWRWSLGTSVSTLQNPGAFYQSPGQYD
ncbi:MAG: PKD domain-containing protein, partial [Bacteroidota bacterium]